jgi:CubicO group peptidase (beta-lactamase class C family)
MIINLKLSGLLAVVLLSSFTVATAEETNDLAPMVTAAETLLAFRDMPYLDKPFIDATPADRKDTIRVGELGKDKGSKEMLIKLAQEIADKNHPPYDSLLISHKGELIFESYYRRGRVDLPQYNATKAYLSMAIGRAIQLGYLTMTDLDKPVISFLKELDPSKFVDGVEKITLHQALTLQSGLRLEREKEEKWQIGSEQMRTELRGQQQIQKYLEHSTPITAESQTFKYSRLDPQLMMQVLDAVVPGAAKDFIRNEVLSKLGITNYRWDDDVSGLPHSMYGAKFTPRDMLKWGMLVKNKGQWNGEQLIAEAYIAKAINRIVSIPDESHESFASKNGTNTGYGYFWWQIDMKVGDERYLCTSATGGGGPYIMLIEELDLIVVTTGHGGKVKPYQLTAEKILPAFMQNAIPTVSEKIDSQDEFPALKTRYFSQKTPGLTPELFAPGIVATEEYRETVVTFSPDMTELAFSRLGGNYKEWTLFVMQYNNDQWTTKPIPVTDMDNYAEKFNPGLSEIKSIEVFKDIPIEGFTISSAGTYYFYTLDYEDGSGYMSYSRLIDGQYEKPHKMHKEINRGKYIAHPFVAPDESYLMWDAEEIDSDTPDIYISFRQPDGAWGAAINMGDKINTAAYEQRPRVTPDGKYLFFWRGDKKVKEDGSVYWTGNPHWVDAKIIESLRSKQ